MIDKIEFSRKTKRIIIVLGMHRGGTSALARGLSVLGVDLGHDLLLPAVDNPKGFWEDSSIVSINERLLTTLRLHWDSISPITEKMWATHDFSSLFDEAVKLLCNRLENYLVWGFKDPRTARLLPFWIKVLQEISVPVSFVIVVRHPGSVAHSLLSREDFSVQKSFILWLLHIISAINETKGFPVTYVNYDKLLDDPLSQIEYLAKKLNLPLLDNILIQEYVSEFLDTQMRHTYFDYDELGFEESAEGNLALKIYKYVDKKAAQWAETGDLQFDGHWQDYGIEFDVLLSDKTIDTLVNKVPEKQKFFVKNTSLFERERETIQFKNALIKFTNKLNLLETEIKENNREIAALRQAIDSQNDGRYTIFRSISRQIKMAKPLKWLSKGKHLVTLLFQGMVIRGGFWKSTLKAFRVTYQEGWSGTRQRLQFIIHGPNALPVVSDSDNPALDYTEWVRRYDTLSDSEQQRILNCINLCAKKPLISIVMPVYNTPVKFLDEAIESVRSQLYTNWELCIADDASTDPEIRRVLEEYAHEDARIKVTFRNDNGHISQASNSALELATGEYIALLDHDDKLAPHALYWVVDAINSNPNARLIYSDEDKIDELNHRHDAYFKSDWNLDLFLSHNMIAHLGVYHAELIQQINGFRIEFEGAQDYDLALRCIEGLQPDQIYHIPKVLYHWRVLPGSTAMSTDEKPYALLAGEKALNDYLDRNKISAKASLLDYGYRVRYNIPQPSPFVSLIIPTRNGYELIHTCIESILNKTDYSNYEIIIVDNGSDCQKTLSYLRSFDNDEKIHVLRDNRDFNFSALNNAAVKVARGEIIGLVNNDVEVISEEWMREMVSHTCRPEVGAVGARLWYPDDTLQHAGVILGIGGVAGHAHKRLKKNESGYFSRAQLIQSFSAVTAACLFVRKSTYEQVGGLDEDNLAIAFNDVDFCLKVGELGLRNVWTPYAELYHHESVSRGYEDTPEKQARFQKEIEFMKKRWGEALLKDPAYNSNLTLEKECFSLAWLPST